MFDRGRHDRHTDAHQASRRALRKGMAYVALQQRVTGKTATDGTGRPLQYADEMAQRHNTRTLDRWAKGWSANGGNAFIVGGRPMPSPGHCERCFQCKTVGQHGRGRCPLKALEELRLTHG